MVYVDVAELKDALVLMTVFGMRGIDLQLFKPHRDPTARLLPDPRSGGSRRRRRPNCAPLST
jgi:hypothetical protein